MCHTAHRAVFCSHSECACCEHSSALSRSLLCSDLRYAKHGRRRRSIRRRGSIESGAHSCSHTLSGTSHWAHKINENMSGCSAHSEHSVKLSISDDKIRYDFLTTFIKMSIINMLGQKPGGRKGKQYTQNNACNSQINAE